MSATTAALTITICACPARHSPSPQWLVLRSRRKALALLVGRCGPTRDEIGHRAGPVVVHVGQVRRPVGNVRLPGHELCALAVVDVAEAVRLGLHPGHDGKEAWAADAFPGAD